MDRSEFKICIDIGHNVKGDNGASTDWGLDENSCAKQIGEKLHEVLKKWGYDVMYSFKEEDKKVVEELKEIEDAKPEEDQDSSIPMFESLRRRCLNSNVSHVDLFVSLHLNSNGDIDDASKNRGTTIFVKTDNEKALANTILQKVCNQHYDLGQDEYSDGEILLGRPYKTNGVKSGENLYVLRNTFSPGILIENLFVDNLMDTQLYKDLKPYINHEHATLEEGVPYVNENALSYNFFAYCIARGIEDYVQEYTPQPYEPKNSDSYDSTPLNYMCYSEKNKDTKLEAVIHKNNKKENLYGGRLFSLLTNERNEFGSDLTVCYLAFKNVDTVQASYASILKPNDVQEGHIKNLANLGIFRDVDGEKAIVFKLKGLCNVYTSDGSNYCTLSAGDYVGVFLTKTKNIYEPSYMPSVYDNSYNYARGPIVCEPTKPYWMKIQFALRKGTKFEKLYNQFNSSDDYAWLETNIGAAENMSDFILELNI